MIGGEEFELFIFWKFPYGSNGISCYDSTNIKYELEYNIDDIKDLN